MATVFKARNTRNVRNAAKLPRSIPIVTYLGEDFWLDSVWGGKGGGGDGGGFGLNREEINYFWCLV